MQSKALTDEEEAELMAMEIREYLDLRGMTTDKEVTLEELAAHLIEIGYRRGKK